MSPKCTLVDLFVRVSESNPNHKGACLLCQKWFMLYYLLVEKDFLHLRVTPISTDHPPDGYAKLNVGKNLPLVTVTQIEHKNDGTTMIDYGRLFEHKPITIAETEEERETLLDSWNLPKLNSDLRSISGVTCELMRSLNELLIHNYSQRMNRFLEKLNEFLKNNATPFIGGKVPNYADCNLGPKLQHLRITCEYYRDFSIPTYMSHIWTYLAHLYQLPAFQISCPADKDILLHYLARVVGCDLRRVGISKTRLFNLPNEATNFEYPRCVVNLASPLDGQGQNHSEIIQSTEEFVLNTYSNGEREYSSDEESVLVNASQDKGPSVNFLLPGLVNGENEKCPWLNTRVLYRRIPPPKRKVQIYSKPQSKLNLDICVENH